MAGKSVTVARSGMAATAALLIALLLAVYPTAAQDKEIIQPAAEDCGACHLNIKDRWRDSAHANAYKDPVFQDWWRGAGQPGECLLCHTTGYNPITGEFKAEGITCEACHGPVNPNHPPEVIPIRSDTEYCGACHTPTHSEWRLSGHAAAGIGCVSCHDPHDQLPLFPVADDMCINCHQGDMGDYLEDSHIQKGIGCVDCHTLVIPPAEMPLDGLVPTGHQFNITPATCVACHTDALHSGFSLPGWERGASVGRVVTPTVTIADRQTAVTQNGARLEQQIQVLEAALASRTMSTIFQGGVIGLVLGGATAWIVAHNVRRRQPDEEEESEE
jgi:hypothetical protein